MPTLDSDEVYAAKNPGPVVLEGAITEFSYEVDKGDFFIAPFRTTSGDALHRRTLGTSRKSRAPWA
jgi:hypothetical protein